MRNDTRTCLVPGIDLPFKLFFCYNIRTNYIKALGKEHNKLKILIGYETPFLEI